MRMARSDKPPLSTTKKKEPNVDPSDLDRHKTTNRRPSHLTQWTKVLISHHPVPIDGETVEPSKNLPSNRVVTSKYTALNFVPKNLFEQFRRIANFYFLIIAIIQVTTNSPVSPLTSLLPLMFVVTTTAVKQGYEDWLRHKMDDAVNSRLIPVLKDRQLINTRSEHIRTGDILLVRDNEEIPCDMILISSGAKQGKCQVTTANLDGETNLKTKECLMVTKDLLSPDSLDSLKGVIECQKPTSDLYEFVGTMKIVSGDGKDTGIYSLGPSNLLVRGSRLRNCPFVYGVAVYTGPDTKLALNSRLTSNKFSSIEKTANNYLISYLVLLVIGSLFSTLIRVSIFDDPVLGNPWYLHNLYKERTSSASFIFTQFLAFFVIYNYIIPISLYVTLETVKFVGSKTLVNDPALIDCEIPEKPKCNSSDLNEELGQVEYLFSDKTGTLTENTMSFKSCVIDGEIFDEVKGKLVPRKSPNSSISSLENKSVEDFFIAICVCNTVQIQEKKNEHFTFSADSPDEKALVEAASRFGIVLTTSSNTETEVTLPSGEKKVFQRLQLFEFDSTRKRMSVIVKDNSGQITLFCKGAECELLPLLTKGNIDKTYAEVDEYATRGLRTLVMSKRSLTAEEYSKLENELDSARILLQDRKEHVRRVMISAERNMTLLGATGVEDKLQDGVPETIRDLKQAGIKIWVLTGDKLETAVSVAVSCQLLDSETTQLVLARQPNADSCEESLNRFQTVLTEGIDCEATNQRPKYGLIVDGRSLHLSMKFHPAKFREVCMNCFVVLCCRMSPIQKAEVVRMVKSAPGNPVTGAIGDGANDVSMIQEAHVGFGLFGKEGRQAVNSSDFAFSRFRFLRPVLLVHGSLFYHRVSTLIHYFFYKNVIFVIPQFIHSFMNAFSTQTLYHGILLMLYNLMYTATPILVFGIQEKHLSESTLLNNPSLYKTISRNRNMSRKQFVKWAINGAIHGVLVYFFFAILWRTGISFDGQDLGLFAFGLLVYHGVIITANLRLGLETRNWSFFFILSLLLSITSLFAFLSLYCNFKWKLLNDNLYGVYSGLLMSPAFWLSLLILPFITLLPDMIIVVARNTIREFTKCNTAPEVFCDGKAIQKIDSDPEQVTCQAPYPPRETIY